LSETRRISAESELGPVRITDTRLVLQIGKRVQLRRVGDRNVARIGAWARNLARLYRRVSAAAWRAFDRVLGSRAAPLVLAALLAAAAIIFALNGGAFVVAMTASADCATIVMCINATITDLRARRGIPPPTAPRGNDEIPE